MFEKEANTGHEGEQIYNIYNIYANYVIYVSHMKLLSAVIGLLLEWLDFVPWPSGELVYLGQSTTLLLATDCG